MASANTYFDEKLQVLIQYMEELYRTGAVALLPTITEKNRTLADQKKYLAQGTSQTLNSYHRLGLAADIWPINPQTNDIVFSTSPEQSVFFKYMRRKAKELGLFLIEDWDLAHVSYLPETADIKRRLFDSNGTIKKNWEKIVQQFVDQPGSRDTRGESIASTPTDSSEYIYGGIDDLREYSSILGNTMQWLPLVHKYTGGDQELTKYLLATIAPESRGDQFARGDHIGGSPQSYGLIQIHNIHGYSPEWRYNPDHSIQWAMNQKRGKQGWNIKQWRQYYKNQGYDDGPEMATKLIGLMQGSSKEYHKRYGEAYTEVDRILQGYPISPHYHLDKVQTQPKTTKAKLNVPSQKQTWAYTAPAKLPTRIRRKIMRPPV